MQQMQKRYLINESVAEAFDVDGKIKEGYLLDYESGSRDKIIDIKYCKVKNTFILTKRNSKGELFINTPQKEDIRVYKLVDVFLEDFTIEKFEMVDKEGRKLYKPLFRNSPEIEIIEIFYPKNLHFRNRMEHPLTVYSVRLQCSIESDRYRIDGRNFNPIYRELSDRDVMLMKVER